MTFALKREGVHLEFLARLFAAVPPAELEHWIDSEPTGQYARRAGFFYEWLTGNRLNFGGVGVGNYVDALDENLYLTATAPDNNQRWRVRDNLPGTRDFCPLVLRSTAVRTAEDYNCAQRLRELEAEYGEDLLMRSAVWLTVKESLASFAIEREDRHIDRVKRFAAVMERRCGHYTSPLDETAITELQREILGPRATRYGLRKSPVFVGESDVALGSIVHYVGPHWDDTALMLSGLKAFAERTAGRSSIARAAVLSFGFVYIHPMADGNGRISRFLINDVLRRDGAVPAPFILPVSATITSTTVNRRGYDQVLEVFSRPLMQRYQDQYRFGREQVAEDGVRYNLEFGAYDDAQPAWRFLDLTDHCEYLAHVIDLTIDQEMRNEAAYLRTMRATRAQIKEVMEGPDTEIDRIIRSVRENEGRISNKLKKDFPLLEDPDVGPEVVRIIQEAFNPTPDEALDDPQDLTPR
ncbi:Fic family protein [Chromobacterium haemolyticum]|uniref:Fic family protein n=1 Tax=Chromobacterium haemolyticum TaxID=394935 RepID=UPI00244D5452|nr:Fic family protein [Chromobacterium haemolyticum]MDH0342065.1 Fic family protein [Chromobacterium haemolyticum]